MIQHWGSILLWPPSHDNSLKQAVGEDMDIGLDSLAMAATIQNSAAVPHLHGDYFNQAGEEGMDTTLEDVAPTPQTLSPGSSPA